MYNGEKRDVCICVVHVNYKLRLTTAAAIIPTTTLCH